MRQSVWDGLWRPGGAFFQIATILCIFGEICATGNAFVRLMPITKMHLLLGSRSERGGARRAPTKRVMIILQL